MKKKTILITGSRGYIGRNITSSLKQRYKLLTPTHKELDLLDQNQVRTYFAKRSISTVIHCALVGGSRKEQFEEGTLHSNLRMFLNIVNHKDKFRRLIFIGSGAEYDKRYPIVHVRESDIDTRIPEDEFGLSKYIVGKIIETLDNAVNLRVFGLFGPGEDYRLRFISNAICRSVQNKPIIINQNVYFDYMYIRDFVKIIKYFITHKPRYNSYNVGSGNKIDLITLAKKINSIAKIKQPIIISNSGLGNEYTCNINRLHKEMKQRFNNKPIDQAIQELYDWYVAHKRSIEDV